ncbi:hypothetical protein [Streptomyces rimosus]|uniref:hypothetical protein n=1 Tax=Streptomyces rimosus TaxID=1927 RepID=UPI000ACFE255|nr:hypothetical protein [Streptomyces rimosus]
MTAVAGTTPATAAVRGAPPCGLPMGAPDGFHMWQPLDLNRHGHVIDTTTRWSGRTGG